MLLLTYTKFKKLRILKKDMEIEKRIETLEKKFDELLSRLDEILIKSATTPSMSCEKEYVKEDSPREFFLRFKPDKDTEKALVATYYLEKKGVQSITVQEIISTLKEMRETLPKNINLSDKMQLLDKRAFVKPSGKEGKKKCWVVTNSGEDFLREMEKNAK